MEIAYDVILAADCLFEKSGMLRLYFVHSFLSLNIVMRPFVQTLSLLIHKKPQTTAYIAYENRG